MVAILFNAFTPTLKANLLNPSSQLLEHFICISLITFQSFFVGPCALLLNARKYFIQKNRLFPVGRFDHVNDISRRHGSICAVPPSRNFVMPILGENAAPECLLNTHRRAMVQSAESGGSLEQGVRLVRFHVGV